MNDDEIKNNGLISQIVNKISTLEEFVRNHQSVQHGAIPMDGWVPALNTWTYSSADSPTFVVSVNGDVTGIISVGMRIKLDQPSTKYFGVTAVGTYSGGVTLITVFGGTGSGAYTLDSSSISSVFYSPVKEPFGFPMDETLWSVSLVETTDKTQAAPVANTVYNLGALSLSIPIGQWDVHFEVLTGVTSTPLAAVNTSINAALSTTNNSFSDPGLRAAVVVAIPAMVGAFVRATLSRRKVITLLAKTTYYLNASTNSATAASLDFFGVATHTTIIARWTGL